MLIEQLLCARHCASYWERCLFYCPRSSWLGPNTALTEVIRNLKVDKPQSHFQGDSSTSQLFRCFCKSRSFLFLGVARNKSHGPVGHGNNMSTWKSALPSNSLGRRSNEELGALPISHPFAWLLGGELGGHFSHHFWWWNQVYVQNIYKVIWAKFPC